jgi:replication-associated recombination protein RarA
MPEPLAERLRPKTLDEYIGQQHLVGPNAILRKMIESERISSFILWGPPGVGKTTLAKIIANRLQRPFFTLSAVTSGVKDVRDVIERAEKSKFFDKYVSKYAEEYKYSEEYVREELSDLVYDLMLNDKTVEFLIVNNSFAE